MAKKKKTAKKNKTMLYSLFVLLIFTATAGQMDLSKVDWSEPSSIIKAFEFARSSLINYGQLKDIPEYDGEHSVVTLNHNQPDFTEESLSLKGGTWQKFSLLDHLNRVGPAEALLHQSMMPTKERGDISNVYPTGWKQKKLSDGTWLYNRSHLIAFRFSGENENWRNLFTGTQQMNQEAMTEYEEKVATYLRKTNNHVRYRVTPYFKENELVPRGVQMEAQSVEDNNLHFNVFLYNIQEGYQINYETGSSKKIR